MTSRFACPCCGFLTLAEPSPSDDICAVCGWQDDFVDNQNTDVLGPNRLKLSRARVNYKCLGYSDPRLRDSVRPPKPEETPS